MFMWTDMWGQQIQVYMGVWIDEDEYKLKYLIVYYKSIAIMQRI